MDTNQSPQPENHLSSTEPVSLFDLLSREGSSIAVLPRINVRGSAAGRASVVPPPPSPPAKRFLSISLPNSPRRPTSVVVHKKKPAINQVSALPSDAAAGEPKHEKHHQLFVGRSKSCGEQRLKQSQSTEYEVCLRRVHSVDHHGSRHFEASFRKATNAGSNAAATAAEKGYWGFTCVYLPAFFKGKPLTKKEAVDIQTMISKTMSREKFECGSWSAAAIVSNGDDDTDENRSSEDDDYNDRDGVDRLSVNLYYELPLEMMESGNKERELKGILTNGVLKERKSNSNSSRRHVRFSTENPTVFPSSPPSSCITPRLRLAREEFNAFLEAQSV